MKALLLNSGMGTRMGDYTVNQPKCMTTIGKNETIISRQLKQIADAGIRDVIITLGAFKEVLSDYVDSLDLPLNITYVFNDKYKETNYIYSIYKAWEYLEDDILLMHGDMVVDDVVMIDMIRNADSCMAVSSTAKLPQKDFKAVIDNGKILKVGIEFFENAQAAQPLYLIKKQDWMVWLDKIKEFCASQNVKCYAENAFNEVSDRIRLHPFDVKDALCNEVDTPEDLNYVTKRLEELSNRTIYMSFSTDMIHSGHIAIIKKAGRMGKIVVGVLSDEAVVSYKRFPLMPYTERKAMFENIVGVDKVVAQDKLSYRDNLIKYKPDIVVHGDNWVNGVQKVIRQEVIEVLGEYGGRLIEFPYSGDDKYRELDRRVRAELATPDSRRARLRKILEMKGNATAMEAHSGLTGLIVENTVVEEKGGAKQFDAMWVSSLCDSTSKGKPDIELVDMTSRFRTIDEICEVTTKPIIFDGDTGGLTEHFVYTVRSLERMGVSMVIIEDKEGLKRNSLFGTEVVQTQASIEEFSKKIKAGKKAQRTSEFMICARIESLILEKGVEDAISRAHAFVEAGADAIMIHSRKNKPDEIFEFARQFRTKNINTPLVVVPTSYNEVTEEELFAEGINIVIYANQMTRAGFPAMDRAAKTILANHRAKECDEFCMSIKEIISLIPDDTE